MWGIILNREEQRIGIVKKIRAFADMGRAQGITTTASVPIVGALTAISLQPSYIQVIYFTLVGILVHTSLNVYIALGDIELDSHTYVPSRNPVAVGTLSYKEAMRYVKISGGLMFLLLFPLIWIVDFSYLIAAGGCLFLAYFWLIWYGYRGKFYRVSYDFSFSASFTFWLLFGVFAFGGCPSIYTWIMVGITVLAVTAFAQWENGLKDADADGAVGVRSFAVLTGVKNNEKLPFTHPYALYGIGLKTGFLLLCIYPYFLSKNIFYLLFVLIYGIPSQMFIMYRFFTKEKPIDHRRTILFDVTLAGILAYSVVYLFAGISAVIFLIIYLIVGYLIGSGLQEECEFKFRRFSKTG